MNVTNETKNCVETKMIIKSIKSDSSTTVKKMIGKEMQKRKYKAFERKLEKLRRENERLRDCGIYWHDACKEAVRDLIGKKKTR